MAFILGKKLKMTQLWKDNKVIPVTMIKVDENLVSFVRTKERDGYRAVQVTSGRTKREFRTDRNAHLELPEFKTGEAIPLSSFSEGDAVTASGISKGRGFQGVVKRHGFHGGPKTHGQKNRFRAPGSIGSTAPQRVVPGKRMAGHMGTERITVKNLRVAGVDVEKNILMLRGAVPGSTGGWIEVVLTKRGAGRQK